MSSAVSLSVRLSVRPNALLPGYQSVGLGLLCLSGLALSLSETVCLHIAVTPCNSWRTKVCMRRLHVHVQSCVHMSLEPV